MDWRPIETAPKDGSDVLLYIPGFSRRIWLGYYFVTETFEHGRLRHRSEGWSIGTFGIGDKIEPTMWHPLPHLPATEQA